MKGLCKFIKFDISKQLFTMKHMKIKLLAIVLN